MSSLDIYSRVPLCDIYFGLRLTCARLRTYTYNNVRRTIRYSSADIIIYFFSALRSDAVIEFVIILIIIVIAGY